MVSGLATLVDELVLLLAGDTRVLEVESLAEVEGDCATVVVEGEAAWQAAIATAQMATLTSPVRRRKSVRSAKSLPSDQVASGLRPPVYSIKPQPHL